MTDKYFVTKNGLIVANTFVTNSTSLTFSNTVYVNSSFIGIGNSFISSNTLLINGQLTLTTNSISSPNQPLYIQNIGSGFGVNISAPNSNTNILGNINVTGSSLFASTITLPGIGGNYIKNGTGDGASYTKYNIQITGSNGIGFTTYDGSIHGFYDTRQGIWDVLGGYNIATIPVIDFNRNFYATGINATSISTSVLNVTGNTNFSNLYSTSLTISGPVSLANSTSSTQLQGTVYLANYQNSGGNIPSSVGTSGLCITWNYTASLGETDFWNQYAGNSSGSQFRFYGKTSSTAANLLLDLQGPSGNTLLNSSLNVNNNFNVGGNGNILGNFSAGSITTPGSISSNGVFSTSQTGAQYIAPGYMHYSDGANYYVLLTGSNTPTTGFNGLRPFNINLNNGLVSLGNTSISGTLGFGSSNIAYATGGYGALTVSGSKNNWSGINFTNNGVGNLGTFMVSLATDSSIQTGFYSDSIGAWAWGFQNGSLNYGTVPESRLVSPIQNLAGSGYRQLPGGLIFQWSTIAGGSDSNWIFPIKFPNICLGVVGSAIDTSSSSGLHSVEFYNTNNQGTTVKPRYIVYQSVGVSSENSFVMAIGF